MPRDPVPSGGGGRPRWDDLPPFLHARVAGLLGSPVVAATSQPGGFSPGSADRVVTAAGRRAFVKAVSGSVNAQSVGIHRREAEVLALLPPCLPIAGLLGAIDEEGWVALVLEDIEGRHPALPWREDELVAVLDALAELAAVVPDERLAQGLEPLEEVLPTGWSTVSPATPLLLEPDTLAWCRRNLDELQALEARAREVVRGERLVHLDVRADNLLLRPDGQVAIVDWPWAVRGAPWFDGLVLLVNVRLFDRAFDVDALVAGHRAFSGIPADAVPAVLAGFTGFFAAYGSLPPPPGLPTLRRFQLDQAESTIAWLRELIGN